MTGESVEKILLESGVCGGILTLATLVIIYVSDIGDNPFKSFATCGKCYFACFGSFALMYPAARWLSFLVLPFHWAIQGWFLEIAFRQGLLRSIWWAVLSWGMAISIALL